MLSPSPDSRIINFRNPSFHSSCASMACRSNSQPGIASTVRASPSSHRCSNSTAPWNTRLQRWFSKIVLFWLQIRGYTPHLLCGRFHQLRFASDSSQLLSFLPFISGSASSRSFLTSSRREGQIWGR